MAPLQLQRMGVDLEGSRSRARREAAAEEASRLPPDDVDFGRMSGREVRDYWARVRAARLGRVQGRQDDEVVGIAQAYLIVTAIVLTLAVLVNLSQP
jgi:hypothetical protein